MRNQYVLERLLKYATSEKDAIRRLTSTELMKMFAEELEKESLTEQFIDNKINLMIGMIDTKIKHSIQVSNDSKETAINLGFNKSNYDFSELCALLHDIGRFKQARMLGSFLDYKLRQLNTKASDHGEWGRILLNKGLINILIHDTREYDQVIKTIVGEHTKGVLPNNLGSMIETIDMFCNYHISEILSNPKMTHELTAMNLQIVQDTDRLDIYHQIIDGSFVPRTTDDYIDKSVFDMFFNGEYLDMQKLRDDGLWNSNVGELVRLTYANQLRLVGVAKVIEQQDIIGEMYDIRNIKERSKKEPALDEAYQYTLEQLKFRIKNSEDGIYLYKHR